MKNNYEIRGNITVIFVFYRGVNLEVVIDTDDLQKAKKFPNLWLGYWTKRYKKHYIVGNAPITNGKRTTIQFHRWILNAPKDMVVDHINGNPLDNRRSNLRIVTQAQNTQNRKGAHYDSKSGVRGVNWREDIQKWRARVMVDGKTICVGHFSDLKEAEKAVKEARAINMPYSLEAKGVRD